jgi:hypothetical protein
MSEEALWQELLDVSQRYIDGDQAMEFREAYRRVARCLSICHRLGVEHPGVELLSRDAYSKAELDAFFQKTWRLAMLHAEQRDINIIEARRGVDRDAKDFDKLRDTLSEARRMILAFGWLPEHAKRRQLDQLEALISELQRARDDFDVALVEVDDPTIAATIEIGRPSGWGEFVRRVFGVVGPTRVDQNRAIPAPETRVLPAPKPEDD